jgi:polar amino acid transport system ATP-binding protein
MTEFVSGTLTGKNLHLSFGHNHVLRGIDLHVEKGTTASVIGPSGSGKSTLLRVMNRLIEPDQGDILLDGRSVLKDNPDELRQRIGMVFQQFNLFPHKTVVDNVSLALRKLRKLSKEQARAEALEQLDLVGLKHKADSRPANLSGGQQQRVAIARALAMKPQVMFFDEATSALV